jgi:hypothetical protein
MVHALPFQRSTNAFDVLGVGYVAPTARQNEDEVQETPVSPSPMSAVFGVGTTPQVEPFHISARVLD